MSIDYAKYVSDLVARARAAQEAIENYTQEQVDELCAAIAYRTTRPEWAQQAAEMLVAESGMGIAANKVAKIYTKVKGGYRDMKGQKSVGLVEVNEETGIRKYARPMG
ncbi:MAG: aldehyde dehydrogenase, partial [Clostridiales bacterium]|nr:aldehyde dehydrogenase [Clostridiales bacterium]